MKADLSEGTRVVLTDPDPAAVEADAMYGPMKGQHGAVEDYAYVPDFGAWYYTVRYDNGEQAISQRHELTVEEFDPRPRQKAQAQIRRTQDELGALYYDLADGGWGGNAERVRAIKLELEDMWAEL